MNTKYLQITLITLLAAIASSVDVWSQNEVVRIKSAVAFYDTDTDEKISNVQIIVFKNGAQAEVQNAGTKGKIDFTLPLGYIYELKISKEPEYVTKILRLDTRNIPEKDRAGGFEIPLDVGLFKYVEGFNTDILKDPMAKMTFNSELNTLRFDESYTATMVKKIEDEFKRLADLAKNGEKMRKEFEKFMKEGDDKMNSTKYEDAMYKYESALGIFPTDATAKAKYDEAKKKFDAEKAAQNANQDYAKLLKEADDLFKNKKWEEAKGKYSTASNLKINEKYPKDQMYLCDQELKKAALDNEYAEAIQEADDRFNNSNFESSIVSYKKALSLKPTEQYPKSQIEAANAAMLELANNKAKQQELENKYKAYLTEGDRLFKDKKFAECIEQYKNALDIKVNENYPKTQITKAEKELKLAQENSNKSNNSNSSGGGYQEAPQSSYSTSTDVENEWRARLIAQEKEMEEIRRKWAQDKNNFNQNSNNNNSNTEENQGNYDRNFTASVDLQTEKDITNFLDEANRIALQKPLTEIEELIKSQSTYDKNQMGILDSLNHKDELAINSMREGSRMSEEIGKAKLAEQESENSTITNIYDQSTTADVFEKSRNEELKNQTFSAIDASETQSKILQGLSNDAKSQSEIAESHKASQQENLSILNKDRTQKEKEILESSKSAEETKENVLNKIKTNTENTNYSHPYELETSERFKDKAQYEANEQSFATESLNNLPTSFLKKEEEQYVNPYSSEYRDYLDSQKTLPAEYKDLSDDITQLSERYMDGNIQVIVRIAKKGNKVDVYRKINSQNFVTYTKNDEPITAQVWQDESESYERWKKINHYN